MWRKPSRHAGLGRCPPLPAASRRRHGRRRARAGAALPAPQLVARHVRQLALDVPQRHVHAADGVVQHGPVAPVAADHHGLPQVLDVARVLADDERADVIASAASTARWRCVNVAQPRPIQPRSRSSSPSPRSAGIAGRGIALGTRQPFGWSKRTWVVGGLWAILGSWWSILYRARNRTRKRKAFQMNIPAGVSWAVRPPSTYNVWPVIYAAALDARKATAAPISFARPSRSSGMPSHVLRALALPWRHIMIRRARRTGRNTVHADAVRRQVHRHRARQRVHRALGRIVAAHAAMAAQTADGGYVDDARPARARPCASRQHGSSRRPCAHCARTTAGTSRDQGRGILRAQVRGVVDQQVHAAELLEGGVEHATRAVRRAHVRRHPCACNARGG